MSYCNWGNVSEKMQNYHDDEWGTPCFDDRKQFEHLMMEALQCGLSWSIVLHKREIFRECFDDFDYKKIADYTEDDVDRILNTEGMIRCQRKIRAIINNAQRYMEIQREFGSFCNYIWNFSNGKTIIYEGHSNGFIPASNGLSDMISKDLKKRGFKYLGSVTVYSHMQACGIINDHDKNCHCYQRINSQNEIIVLPPDNEHNVHQY